MNSSFNFTDAIRIQVKKFDGIAEPESLKFSVDPQITTFDMLRTILSKAFDTDQDFHVFYEYVQTLSNQEHFEQILNDSDLQIAFNRAYKTTKSDNEPCLYLILKAIKNGANIPLMSRFKVMSTTKFLSSAVLMDTIEKTFTKFQKVLSFNDEQHYIENPVTYFEYKKFLNPVGKLDNFDALRKHIFYRGIEPSLRKVLWRHLLNVYPDGMTGEERINYIRRKSNEYYELQSEWVQALDLNSIDNNLIHITRMIQKDVLRTDRYHEFYSGNDNNKNLKSLFNILTTYSLNHPKTGYCQGMNDFASALLVTMKNEALAYICFCALMKRIYRNFTIDEIAMTQKFSHLIDALRFYDFEFYNYLRENQADGLLFCYRWILLEMKREFAFDDSLLMFEVLWSSLPFKTNNKELNLFEEKFKISLRSKSSLNDISLNNYCNKDTYRKSSLNNLTRYGSDEHLQNQIKASLSHNNFLLLRKKKERLNSMSTKTFQSCDNFDKKLIKNFNEFYQLQKSPSSPTDKSSEFTSKISEIFIWRNPLKRNEENKSTESISEDTGISSLPPPNHFGGGNPFLMFLCLTMLLQSRNIILEQHMDHNEMAMFFDKLIRKNNVHKVLNQARLMFVEYLEQF